MVQSQKERRAVNVAYNKHVTPTPIATCALGLVCRSGIGFRGFRSAPAPSYFSSLSLSLPQDLTSEYLLSLVTSTVVTYPDLHSFRRFLNLKLDGNPRKEPMSIGLVPKCELVNVQIPSEEFWASLYSGMFDPSQCP